MVSLIAEMFLQNSKSLPSQGVPRGPHPGVGRLTLKLYLTMFWGACGLLAVRMRVNSSFSSWGREIPRGSYMEGPPPLLVLGVPADISHEGFVQAANHYRARAHLWGWRRWKGQGREATDSPHRSAPAGQGVWLWLWTGPIHLLLPPHRFLNLHPGQKPHVRVSK